MLPIAMISGVLFHEYLTYLSFLTPALIFCMLLFTFCKLSPNQMNIKPFHFLLFGIQLFGGLLVYGLLMPFNPLLAQGIMICVLVPTATSAAIVTGMLGGSIAFLASFVFISNVGIAIAAPIIFSYIGANSELPFWESFGYICRQVVPLLIFPLLCAWGLQKLLPRVHGWMLAKQKISFYLWALALTIVTGKTVTFFLSQESPNYSDEILLAVLALIVCIFQFLLGRRLGKRYGDVISVGQALGQKNTILAIWMAQIYLLPVAAIAPASYVLWQNIINSWQLWKKRKKDELNRA